MEIRALKANRERMKRSCPVCGESESRLWFRPSSSPGPVVRCRECGFVYVNPIESTKALIQDGPELGDYPVELLCSHDISEIEGSWEEPFIRSHLSECGSKEENARRSLNQITRLVESPAKMLDIGCFCGIFLRVAQELGWDCYGVEPLVMPSIYARGKYGLNVVTDTLH